MKSWLKIILLVTSIAVIPPLWYYYHQGNQPQSLAANLGDQSDHAMQQVLVRGKNRLHKNKHGGGGKHLKLNHIFDKQVLSHKTAVEIAEEKLHRFVQKNSQVPRKDKLTVGDGAKASPVRSQGDKKKLPPRPPDTKREVAFDRHNVLGGGGMEGGRPLEENGRGAVDSLVKKKANNKNKIGGNDVRVLPKQKPVVKKTFASQQQQQQQQQQYKVAKQQDPKSKKPNKNLPKQQRNKLSQLQPPAVSHSNTSLHSRQSSSQTNPKTPLRIFKTEQSRLNDYLQATNKKLETLDNTQRLYFLDRPCGDVLCTEFLVQSDFANFTTCMQRGEHRLEVLKRNTTNLKSQKSLKADISNGLVASGECRFMDGNKRRDLIGLVSFPGSGNTWVRGLLQKATGICTGAVYCDVMLRLSGLDGEGVQSSSVLAIKSHSSIPNWTSVQGKVELSVKGRPNFDSVIFIFRNPYDAIVSEWNRQLSTKYRLGKGKGVAHTARYGLEYFGEFKDWIRFVTLRIKQWSSHFDWIISCHAYHDILVVRYEDLREDSFQQVKRMLDFLRYPYTDSQLKLRLHDDFTTFQRPAKPDFDPYSSTEREVVAMEIRAVVTKLKEETGQMFGVEEYLLSEEQQ